MVKICCPWQKWQFKRNLNTIKLLSATMNLKPSHVWRISPSLAVMLTSKWWKLVQFELCSSQSANSLYTCDIYLLWAINQPIVQDEPMDSMWQSTVSLWMCLWPRLSSVGRCTSSRNSQKNCEITIQGFQAPLCKAKYSSFLTTYKLNHTKCERIWILGQIFANLQNYKPHVI